MPLSGTDPARGLVTLQRLLEIPATDLKSALTHAANALADALGADKVDAFLYDEARDSLVAEGTSTQPLSNLQKRLGLDVLPVSNGGRVVDVYKTGKVFRTGRLLEDPEELRGVKEGLKIQSKLGVPLYVGTRLRGIVMIASVAPDYFDQNDEFFARSATQWVGMVAHRAELIQEIERNALQQGRRAAAEELITVLAHDLRNYISPIASRVHLLRYSAESRSAADDVAHADAALKGVGRLGGLVSSLLDVARLDRGLLDLDVEPVDVANVAREAAALFSTTENEVLVRSSEALLVSADSALIRQCLDNLLSNAVNHSPRGAPVNVFISGVEGDGRRWGRVEVRDEGPGVPQELLPHIFEQFTTSRARKGGAGLGLYLAQRIATAHGGELDAESPPGEGARFVLRIPRYEEEGISADR